MNRHPVVNVPVGVAGNNIPIGMQVVGNTYDDLGVLRVASFFSRAVLHLFSGDRFPRFQSKP